MVTRTFLKNSQANGLVKRKVSNFKKKLWLLNAINKIFDVQEAVARVSEALNNTITRGTGFALNAAIRILVTKSPERESLLQILETNNSKYTSKRWTRNHLTANERRKRNRKIFNVDNQVNLYSGDTGLKMRRLWDSLYLGPYRITQRLSPVSYLINFKLKKDRETALHIRFLKKILNKEKAVCSIL
jgi:hypothetical protein